MICLTAQIEGEELTCAFFLSNLSLREKDIHLANLLYKTDAVTKHIQDENMSAAQI